MVKFLLPIPKHWKRTSVNNRNTGCGVTEGGNTNVRNQLKRQHHQLYTETYNASRKTTDSGYKTICQRNTVEELVLYAINSSYPFGSLCRCSTHSISARPYIMQCA